MNPIRKLYPPVIDLWGLRWLARYMDEGALFPRGYGVAWRRWLSDGPKNVTVVMPMPLNWAAGMALSFFDGLRRGPALPYPTREMWSVQAANELSAQRRILEREGEIMKLKAFLAEALHEIPSCSGRVAHRIRVLKQAISNREDKWRLLRILLVESSHPSFCDQDELEKAEIALGLRPDPNPPKPLSEAENVERQELTPSDEQNQPVTATEVLASRGLHGKTTPLDPEKTPEGESP